MLFKRECGLGWAAVLLITAVLILRAATLLRKDLWYDEAWSTYSCRLPRGQMKEWIRADLHPYGYHIAARYWGEFLGGVNKLTMRSFSLLWGMVGIAAAGWFARRMFGDWRNGLAAMTILALSPQHFYYSQEARMYSMGGALVLIGCGAAWELVNAAAQGKKPSPFAFLIGWGAAFGAVNTHYLCIVFLAVYSLLQLATYYRELRRRNAIVSSWLFFWGIFALSVLGMGIELLGRLNTMASVSQWMEIPTARELIWSFGVSWLIYPHMIEFISNPFVPIISIVILIWLFWTMRWIDSPRRSLIVISVGAFLGGLTALFVFAHFGIRCFYWSRYGALALPVASVGFGALLLERFRRKTIYDAIVGSVLLLGMFLMDIHGSCRHSDMGYRDLHLVLQKHRQWQEIYLFGATFWPEYELNLQDSRIRPGKECRVDALPSSGRVAFVLFSSDRGGWNPQETALWQDVKKKIVLHAISDRGPDWIIVE